MIYDIKQTTHYAYGESVPVSRHMIRMQPPHDDGQSVIAASLNVQPAPHERNDTRDFFGNHLTQIAIDAPHETLTVTLHARVRVEQTAFIPADDTLAWEEVVRLARESSDIGPHAPVHRLFPSRMVPLDPALTAYAALSFPVGRPVLAGATELAERIQADFVYDPTATAVDTDPVHAFALRRGVCQDFAHIMIAGLRGLGLPAGYVSGFLRTVPPPGQQRLEGADATHAWVSVWCGPKGWIGLDPTNGMRADLDHVRIAEGRDYADVAPLDGIIWSAAGHSLSVAVDVVPVSGSA
ncbi:MAG: transglutaminase family protein [Beijerinckiaceae bacterium]|nr:transglutaminase family protein [Beijerinckiaceae bacterium]